MNCDKSFLRKKPTHQSTMRNIITLNKQNQDSSNFPERTEINTCLWGNKSPIFDLFASIQLSMNPRRAVDICLNCKFTTKHIQSKPLRIKTQSIVYKFYYGTPFRIHYGYGTPFQIKPLHSIIILYSIANNQNLR